jgi:hypothetical protein
MRWDESQAAEAAANAAPALKERDVATGEGI